MCRSSCDATAKARPLIDRTFRAECTTAFGGMTPGAAGPISVLMGRYAIESPLVFCPTYQPMALGLPLFHHGPAADGDAVSGPAMGVPAGRRRQKPTARPMECGDYATGIELLRDAQPS